MDRQTAELLNVLTATLPVKENKFFSNIARLSTVLQMVDKYATSTDKILDLGCGAFVLDSLLESKCYTDITAVDKNETLKGVYKKLQNAGLLKHTVFINSDVTATSVQSHYSLVVLNDALFYQDVDLPQLLTNIRGSLPEGGYFIFDVWRSEFHDRFRAVYDRIYSRYRAFKRYSYAEVAGSLDKYGFSIEEIVPWFSTQPATRFVQRLLWLSLRLANDTYFVAKRKGNKVI